jgi:hypothetical protein
MAYTLTVPIPNPKKPPKVVFPETCLHCGKPKAGTRGILFTLAENSKKTFDLDLEPPLCNDCITLENRLEWFSLLPFTIVGFLLGALTFLFLWLIVLPNLALWDFLGMDWRETNQAVWVLAGAGALLGGIGGATLVEVILRVLTKPYFGDLLTSRPLTLVSLLRDFHDVPGLRAQVTSDKKILTLTFEHEERAREFAMLNNLQEI